MARPRRRHYIALSRELGMTVNEMLSRMDSAELAEQVAYDALRNDEYREGLQKQLELEQSRQQDVDDRKAAFRQLLRRIHGNNR